MRIQKPKKELKKNVISFKLTDMELMELDVLVEKSGYSRCEFLRQLVKLYYEEEILR